MCNKEECGNCGSMKFPKITSVFLILTEKCNLACKYCFVKQNAREMDLETAKNALHFIVSNWDGTPNNKPSINFFGGEPMLKYKEIIRPLIEYSKETYGEDVVKFSMTTNGTLFTKEILDYLKENNVGLLVSIDGDKESHNANRVYHNGKGSFEDIEKTLDYYLKLYPQNILRCTLEKNNLERMINSIEFGLEKGFNSFFFIPNCFSEWSDEHKIKIKEQIRLFGDLFMDYMRKGKVIRLTPFDEKIQQIKRINDTARIPYVLKGEHKCGLGANRFASVGTDGTLYGCQEMTSNCGDNDVFIIGDIYNGADEEKRSRLLNSFNPSSVTSHEKCKTCKLLPICNGGCVANNYLQTKDLSRQADILCYWEQELLEEAIRVTRILGEEKNELFKKTYFVSRRGR